MLADIWKPNHSHIADENINTHNPLENSVTVS